jgi:hypothetical protein
MIAFEGDTRGLFTALALRPFGHYNFALDDIGMLEDAGRDVGSPTNFVR